MLGFPLLFITSLLYLGAVSSHNILVVNPIYGYSHAKFLGKLADLLAEGGHSVTVLQHYHSALKNSDKLIKNETVEVINYFPENYEEMLKTDKTTFAEFWDSKMMANLILGSVVVPKMLAGVFTKEAMRVLNDTELHQKLRDRNFDAVVGETFEMSSFYLAHILKVPVITAISGVRVPSQSLLGQPSSLGYVPGEGSQLAPMAGFLDRLNDWYCDFFSAISFNGILEEQHKAYSEVLGGDVPHWTELIRKSPLFFLNANPYIDFATPSTGNMIKIGGITIAKERKQDALPEEYTKILEERPSTVLVSFGSVVRSYQMPENFKAGVIQMFENLPNVTFIWKYEMDDEEFQKRIPRNVHLKKWVPQPSLLADERLKVFVTHGGLGSTHEVAYSGKPALMIPLFGDQPQNAQMLARHGGAVAYSKYDLPDGRKLTAVVKELVSNQKYRDNAESLRIVLRNQPIDPRETFLKHVDFAVKFPNLHSQVPEISRVGVIGFYYIDVIFFFFSLTALFVYCMFKLVQRKRRRMNRGEKPKDE